MSEQHDIYDRAFRFACGIVRLYQQLWRRPGAARNLASQLLRSGTSLGANLEEANAANSKADFVAKCRIALKEARESHYWLRLLAASDLVPAAQLKLLVNESNELVAILTAILRKSSVRRTEPA